MAGERGTISILKYESCVIVEMILFCHQQTIGLAGHLSCGIEGGLWRLLRTAGGFEVLADGPARTAQVAAASGHSGGIGTSEQRIGQRHIFIDGLFGRMTREEEAGQPN